MKQGALLEQLVAAIQDHLKGQADVKIELNKRLPDRDGHKREIDVYVTRQCQGQPLAFAFECKDYTKPVDVKVVDAFFGKCQELPEITGRVIVSSSGYTKLAIESAAKRGIQLRTIEDIKAEHFFAPYIAHDVRVKAEIACEEWRFNFRDWIRTDLVDNTKQARFFDDDSEVNLVLEVYKQLYSQPILTQLGARFMEFGKRPFNTIIKLKPKRDIYVEDIQGEKHIVDSIDIPISVDVVLTPMAVASQKNYAPIADGTEVTITEFDSEHQRAHMVSIDSTEGHSIFVKDENGNMFKPTTLIKGNFPTE